LASHRQGDQDHGVHFAKIEHQNVVARGARSSRRSADDLGILGGVEVGRIDFDDT
jgi:hypothetical protein